MMLACIAPADPALITSGRAQDELTHRARIEVGSRGLSRVVQVYGVDFSSALLVMARAVAGEPETEEVVGSLALPSAPSR